MKYIFNAFRHCLDFRGKTNREEYLMFWIIMSFILTLAYIGDKSITSSHFTCSTVISIVIALPALAITVRRLHDTGKRGWWAFLQMLVALAFAPFLLFNPNSTLLIPFFIIEGLLSLLMFYLVLQPSDETSEE